MTDIYGGTDPRDIPVYSIGDAARYLRIPAGTIRSWTVGRDYVTANGPNFFSPLIQIQDYKPRLLSFTNLVEVHVLRADDSIEELAKDYNCEREKIEEAIRCECKAA